MRVSEEIRSSCCPKELPKPEVSSNCVFRESAPSLLNSPSNQKSPMILSSTAPLGTGVAWQAQPAVPAVPAARQNLDLYRLRSAKKGVSHHAELKEQPSNPSNPLKFPGGQSSPEGTGSAAASAPKHVLASRNVAIRFKKYV